MGYRVLAESDVEQLETPEVLDMEVSYSQASSRGVLPAEE
jgi:hypothetical protein